MNIDQFLIFDSSKSLKCYLKKNAQTGLGCYFIIDSSELVTSTEYQIKTAKIAARIKSDGPQERVIGWQRSRHLYTKTIEISERMAGCKFKKESLDLLDCYKRTILDSSEALATASRVSDYAQFVGFESKIIFSDLHKSQVLAYREIYKKDICIVTKGELEAVLIYIKRNIYILARIFKSLFMILRPGLSHVEYDVIQIISPNSRGLTTECFVDGLDAIALELRKLGGSHLFFIEGSNSSKNPCRVEKSLIESVSRAEVLQQIRCQDYLYLAVRYNVICFKTFFFYFFLFRDYLLSSYIRTITDLLLEETLWQFLKRFSPRAKLITGSGASYRSVITRVAAQKSGFKVFYFDCSSSDYDVTFRNSVNTDLAIARSFMRYDMLFCINSFQRALYSKYHPLDNILCVGSALSSISSRTLSYIRSEKLGISGQTIVISFFSASCGVNTINKERDIEYFVTQCLGFIRLMVFLRFDFLVVLKPKGELFRYLNSSLIKHLRFMVDSKKLVIISDHEGVPAVGAAELVRLSSAVIGMLITSPVLDARSIQLPCCYLSSSLTEQSLAEWCDVPVVATAEGLIRLFEPLLRNRLDSSMHSVVSASNETGSSKFRTIASSLLS